jgi:hypothetical protein
MGISMDKPPIVGPPPSEPEISPDRRAFILQVVLPLFIGLLVLAALIVLVWQSGLGTASAWADTSLIFLLIPWLCVGLLPLVALGALWYGVFKLTTWLPGPLRKGKEYIDLGNRYMRRGMDVAVKPMFTIKGIWAVVTAFFKGLASLIGIVNGESHE